MEHDLDGVRERFYTNLSETLTEHLREMTGEGEIKYRPHDRMGGLPKLPPDKRPTTTVYSVDCYICRDPEFALYGLPLCRACPYCGGHVAADDTRCDVCGRDDQEYWEAQIEAEEDVSDQLPF